MQFRLTYEGKLLGSGGAKTRADHKHEIRMRLHPQIKRLWRTSGWLKELAPLKFPTLAKAISGHTLTNPTWSNEAPYLELLANAHVRHDRKWAPLLGDDMGLTCGVEVLFLRPGSRGGVLNVGDIDGRLKTLFDALAIPTSESGLPASDDEQPIYVLLSDDRHISHVAVETDELLEPTSAAAGENDARVILTVNIRPLRANYFTLGFSSF